MKVVAFRHMYSEGLGSLGQVIEKSGGSYQYIDTYREPLDGFDPAAPDLLIVLGGSPGVYQAEDYPFLKDEMRMIEKRLEKNLPILGICLGAQLMAEVLGGKVYKGKQGSEIGWFPMTLTDEGKKTQVKHFCKSETSLLCWHGDTFDMPKGATLLATSEKYRNQAYSYGANAIGLQFHCEITPHMLKGWSVSGASLVAEGTLDLKKLRADTEEFGPKLMTQTEKFITGWMAETGVIKTQTGAAAHKDKHAA
jgi:GMP synthase (glutamine-hydrolysing)